MLFSKTDFDEVSKSLAEDFLSKVSEHYDNSFGIDYHMKRFYENRCLLFVGREQPCGEICTGCYIKPSGRRCATFVARDFRGTGVACKLIKFSLKHISKQYSILSASNTSMIESLFQAGFSKVKNQADVKSIAEDEYKLIDLSTFNAPNYFLTRYSQRRDATTGNLILLQKGFIDG